MTIVYSQNFDGTTVGTLPAGWHNVNGYGGTGSPSNWLVENSVFVSSPNALSAGSPGDGSTVLYEGSGALADMEIRYDYNPSSGPMGGIGGFVRTSSDGANGYYVTPYDPTNPSGVWKLFRLVSGSATELQSSGTVSVSGNISVRINITGSTIKARWWSYGTTEPSVWDINFTDGSPVSASGYAGFRMGGGNPTTAAADNFTLDDLAPAGTDFTLTPSSLTTAPGSATTNYIVTPNGTPSSSTVIALSDGGAGGGGVFTPSLLTFTTATPQTFIYTPNAGATSSPITLTATATGGFSATHTTQCALNIPATNFTLTPSSLTTNAGVATGNYTVTLNGTLSTNETIALTDASGGGTFTPSSLTFTSGNAATPQTFTYTPSSGAGGTTKTLTATGSGQFSASHTTSCVVNAGPQAIPVTNADIFWSPGNWDHLTSGTFGVSTDTMQATSPGAYFKFGVTGTVNLTIDIDNSTTSSFSSGQMPIVRLSIDGGNFVDAQLNPAATSLVLSNALTTGPHQVEVFLRGFPLSHDAWGSSGVSPVNVLRINGIIIDGAASMVAPTLLAKRAMFFGDSMTQGEHVLGDGSDDATQAWTPIISQVRGLEYGQIAYGGTGWETSGAANVPKFMTSYPLFSVGRARSFSGLDEVWSFHGLNDQIGSVASSTIQTDCQTWLAAMRAACGGSTSIFVCTSPQGSYISNLSAAVAAYKAGSGDNKVYFIDVSTLFAAGIFNVNFVGGGDPFQWTWDGQHPTAYGHARLGAAYAAAAANTNAGTTGVGSRSRIANA